MEQSGSLATAREEPADHPVTAGVRCLGCGLEESRLPHLAGGARQIEEPGRGKLKIFLGYAAGVGKAFVAEIERQLEQDIPIWENKIQHEHPLLCDGDGPIGVFRRWSRQFYCWPEEARAAE